MVTDEIKQVSSFDFFDAVDSANEQNSWLADGLLFDGGKRHFLGFDSCESNVLAERDAPFIEALYRDEG